MKITHELEVHSVTNAPPFVRVRATFLEGGTQSQSHTRSEVSFLADTYDRITVGKKLVMTIEEKT